MLIRKRAFFRGAAGALAAMATRLPAQAKPMSEHTVAKIEIFPTRYPMIGYFKFFTGPHGGAGRAAVIVKITTESGVVGWGQSVPIAKWSYETLETATTALREYFAPALKGHDALDIAGAHATMDKAVAMGFSTGMPITRAGIDIALWDIKGKVEKKSLAELCGRKPLKELTLSWTVGGRTLDECQQAMEQGRARGFRNFNIKVAPDPKFDVELAKAVRKFAPDGFLWADANGGYDPATALAAAPKLADAGVDILEAPIKPNQISGYKALTKLGALPILMDEGVVSPVEAEEFFKLGMCDGLAMKPARCGGLTSNKAQIELCEKHDKMWVGSGLTDPDISLAATAGLYAAYGLKKPAALNGPQFLTADILKSPLQPKKDILTVPTGHGLGVEVDEEKLRELLTRKN